MRMIFIAKDGFAARSDLNGDMEEAELALYPLVGVILADILLRIAVITTCNTSRVQRNLLRGFHKNLNNPAIIKVLLSLSLCLCFPLSAA